jgi:hypothetical protein
MTTILLEDLDVHGVLWLEYVATDFGRKLEWAHLRGFGAFVARRLPVTVETGPSPAGLMLNFESDEDFIMCRLQYS